MQETNKMISDATYNIAESHFSSKSMHVDCLAFSGGRAGAHNRNKVDPRLANNALATHVHSGVHHFGPLPQGRYSMAPHESHPLKVRLNPLPGTNTFGRGSFEIHGHGDTGSHGCIVPANPSDLHKICAAVKSAHAVGKSLVLEVVAIGANIDRKFNQALYTA
jgi:hypothetical protein